ncbi:MAG TPA: AtpZ/AtpI family protein [Candidatus Saccharimonadales bacterium]
MKQTKAPRTTPSPDLGGNSKSPNAVFVSMALDMSWKLAIVVLVPIIGGFKLDDALDTTPLLTITGFILAMGGMALVMWQTMQIANTMPVAKKEKHS